MISLIQDFEADFLWKVSLKILNWGIILKSFTKGWKTNIFQLVIRIVEICGVSYRLISTKVWDKARDELVTPGSAVGLATDCATGSGINH